ncbi:hypothetical protein [Angustibacter aerolatus]
MPGPATVIGLVVRWGPRLWGAAQVLTTALEKNPELRRRVDTMVDGVRRAQTTRSRPERLRRTLEALEQPVAAFEQSDDAEERRLGEQWRQRMSALRSGLSLAQVRSGLDRHRALGQLDDGVDRLFADVFGRSVLGDDADRLPEVLQGVAVDDTPRRRLPSPSDVLSAVRRRR